VDFIVKERGQSFAEEDNVWLNQAVAIFFDAVNNLLSLYVLAKRIFGESCAAFDAVLVGKTSMGLHDQIGRDSGAPLQSVDILGEQLMQEMLFGQETDENMRDCWKVFPWVDVLGKDIEGLGVLLEVLEVKHVLGSWQVECLEVGV